MNINVSPETYNKIIELRKKSFDEKGCVRFETLGCVVDRAVCFLEKNNNVG